MKRIAFVLVFLVAAGAAHGEWKSLLGKTAPPLEVKSWTNAADAESLDEFRGRTVLVVLYPSESSALQGFVSRAEELRAFYGPGGFEVIGVAVGEKVEAGAARFPVG